MYIYVYIYTHTYIYIYIYTCCTSVIVWFKGLFTRDLATTRTEGATNSDAQRMSDYLHLDWWGCIKRVYDTSIEQLGHIPVKLSHRSDRWGLRKTPEEAMQRGRLFDKGTNKTTHIVFAVRFTLLGWAYYTQKLMHGMPVCGISSDGIVHFWEDIPLEVTDSNGELLLRVEFHEIE